jgi:YbgC/YbaW family acyl-CoA thioester hydrolase
MAFEFIQQRRVEFAETDMAGIVHFANFFRWMESAEHAFLRSLGYSVHTSRDGRATGWPRLKVRCDYSKPLRFEEDVDVVLSVAEVRTRSVRYAFVIRRSSDGEVAARGETVAVHAQLDPAGGRLQAAAIPEELRARLAACVEPGNPQS